ncbi:MAG TPA: BolA/IbaG family iron-sulfur metabolism protein [Gammaproteobacteria bacterium]|nr:BolA/IbaG family iron-sulfur metabolism protein [Gammaproteobacteria bacterium]
MNPETIKQLLEEGLNDARVEVVGDGQHFQALIVTPDFEGEALIARHRRVNAVLREHIDSNMLHAISMRTLTPGEAAGEGR